MAVRELTVTYKGKDRFSIEIGDHVVVVDQPVDAGGDDEGPTPTELFVAGLVSCMGFFAERFLRRNGVDPEGLGLTARTTMIDRPSRVDDVSIDITIPVVSDELVAALHRVVERCTVHNSLREPPVVAVSIQRPEATGGTDVA